MQSLPSELRVSEDFQAIDYQDWRDLVERDLRGAPFERKLVTHTYEGIRLKPLYTIDDAIEGGERAGFAPFTRGSRVVGSATQGWDVRQEHTEALPSTANAAVLADLAHGVNSVLIRFDAAARSGFDADSPDARRLVGHDGMTVYGLQDFKTLFEGVHLNMIGVALEAGAAFAPAAALTASLWKANDIDPKDAKGAFNADPLAVLAREGRLPMPLDLAYARMAQLAKWTAANYPNVTSVRVGSAPYHHAGATAAQDLAFSIATGIEYLRELTSRGMSVDDASRQMLFSYGVGCNFFLAAAKLRTARRLWSRVVEMSGGGDEASRMKMHVRTSKRVMTARDPWVNLLRNTTGLFAAAVADAECVTSSPFDAPLGPSSARAQRTARNTATILAEESHLLRVADPAGGSWFVEQLTDELAEKAWVILQAIENQGGMSAALRSGWVHEQLADTLTAREKNLATRRDAVIGVSEFPNPEEKLPHETKPNPAVVLGDARARVLAQRGGVDAPDPELPSSEDAPDLMDRLVDAFGTGATIGRCSSAILSGEPETLRAPITLHAYAEPFERLRNLADSYEQDFGFRPRVFLAQIGSLAEYTARAGYATSFFQAGGFEVLPGDALVSPEAAAEAFAGSGAGIAVLCSTDGRYEAEAAAFARAIRNAGARTVILAGNPGEKEADYRACGIDRFIFMRCDVLDTLTTLLAEEGVQV